VLRLSTLGCMTRILFVIALLFAVAACGDDDDAADLEPVTGVDSSDTVADPSTDPGGDPDPELLTAVESYAKTVIEGDPDAALELRSSTCAEVETDIPTNTDAGDSSDDLTISDFEAEIDGDEASVTYRVDPGADERTEERWVREDGQWKWNNC